MPIRPGVKRRDPRRDQPASAPAVVALGVLVRLLRRRPDIQVRIVRNGTGPAPGVTPMEAPTLKGMSSISPRQRPCPDVPSPDPRGHRTCTHPTATRITTRWNSSSATPVHPVRRRSRRPRCSWTRQGADSAECADGDTCWWYPPPPTSSCSSAPCWAAPPCSRRSFPPPRLRTPPRPRGRPGAAARARPPRCGEQEPATRPCGHAQRRTHPGCRDQDQPCDAGHRT